MLLLLLILQLLPPPAKQAVAEAMRNRYSWQRANEKLPATWAVSFSRMEYRRPTFELVWYSPVEFEPSDPRVGTINWDLARATKLPSTLLTSGFGDASLPGGKTLGERISQPQATVTTPVATPQSSPVTDSETSTTTLAFPPIGGNLSTIVMTRRMTSGDVEPPTLPDTDTPDGGVGGIGGGVGGGVGSSVPEPAGILMPAGALALILSRRSRRQNPAK